MIGDVAYSENNNRLESRRVLHCEAMSFGRL